MNYHQYQYQSQIYLARASFVIKTQSEARLESELLLVHVMAEVVCLRMVSLSMTLSDL